VDVLFEASFARDLKRVKDKQLLQRVQSVIEEIKAASEAGLEAPALIGTGAVVA